MNASCPTVHQTRHCESSDGVRNSIALTIIQRQAVDCHFRHFGDEFIARRLL